jgi:hypothetical protein
MLHDATTQNTLLLIFVVVLTSLIAVIVAGIYEYTGDKEYSQNFGAEASLITITGT